MTTATQLHRIRWAVRATLALGVAASVAANILHANHNPISQTIAAWPPLALLLTVELISRIPVHRAGLSVVRISATAIIAGIAAWVSYWHMVGVCIRYGETTVSAHLMPLSVDGLIAVASISLVELAGRIRATDRADAHTTPTIGTEPPAAPTSIAPAADPGTPITDVEPRPDTVPAALLPGARIIAASHRQATGQPITPLLLAERMNLPADTADRILTALGEHTGGSALTVAHNGHPHGAGR
ncbi:DUF2637 domain-containing protein [Planosporangium mesophilum]|uniref:DUF2637 domain-containing protein n=1 Tax=Planosporangium mesophilum TaxID=689768 RepID=A0A8J3TKR7_9ACTN|nr:DUF2637 domain-containing protein [Planosporangium mesophilum]NJC85360.1 DUF2637 domain-containing protein [Planosporangium mesophilum]GII23175.1 hypothetical protein Pme01_27720 [Planosporangium mesophilum]